MRLISKQKPDAWRVYILCCADGTFYAGATNSIERRLGEHNRGTASKYTRSRRPVTLLASSGPMSKSEALRLERKIKKLPRAKKTAGLTMKECSTFQKYAKRTTASIARKKENRA
ncbi:MAG: GIY-YIG nuclease family protein [Smithellaceae bacterium]|nr:GIY-YIG nuclease family protein [Smithellaceae bacterium]